MRLELTFRDYRLDLLQMILYKGSMRINTRRQELHMLSMLVLAAPRIVSARELHESIKGYSYDRIGADKIGNSVMVQLSRLRESLRPDNLIETIKGEGYRFNGESQVTAADLPLGSRVERDGEIVYRF